MCLCASVCVVDMARLVGATVTVIVPSFILLTKKKKKNLSQAIRIGDCYTKMLTRT